MESPYNGKSIIQENFDGIEIFIPTKKNWFVIIFLGAWLGGWAMGETSAISTILELLNSDTGFANFFLLFWLCGWTVGGFFAFKTLLWNLIGKEIIRINKGVLNLEKRGLLLTKPKSYDLNEAKNFRVQEENDALNGFGGMRKNNFNALNQNVGTLRFDYGLKTIKFANGIDEAEARYILEKLKHSNYLKDSNF